MYDYRNSPTIKFCADLFPAHRRPSVLKPLDDPTRLLLRCSRWSLGHRSSDVKSSTAKISSHLSNRALLFASDILCDSPTVNRGWIKLAQSPVTKNVGLQIFKSASLLVCKSAGLQVCSLRLSHTGYRLVSSITACSVFSLFNKVAMEMISLADFARRRRTKQAIVSNAKKCCAATVWTHTRCLEKLHSLDTRWRQSNSFKQKITKPC